MKVEFAGQSFLLHASGAIYWPAQEMLIIADAHLEKGSFFAKWGFHLPPYDSHQTLKLLLEVCETFFAKRILILGDFLHDNRAQQRLSGESMELLNELRKKPVTWIKGNHDFAFQPESIELQDTYSEAGIIFRHEALGNSAPEISGHFHPKAKIIHKGQSLDGRCFIEDGKKFILPAFGAYTGGLSIRSKAISRHFSEGMRTYIIINDRVVEFPMKYI